MIITSSVPDIIKPDRSGTGVKSISPEESHHFDSPSTDQQMMAHSNLANKSATSTGNERDQDVLDTIYDKVIEDSRSEITAAHRPLHSENKNRSIPLREDIEMTPQQLMRGNQTTSKDTVLCILLMYHPYNLQPNPSRIDMLYLFHKKQIVIIF